MLIITTVPYVVSSEKEAEDGFEKFDLPFDVYLTISVVINNKIQLPIHNSWQPLLQPFFKHIDIISFLVYENSDTPEYLYATMKVRDFQYSEIRSCYAIYWTYNDRTYYTGTNTHTKGETIAPIAGYFDEGGTAYDSSIEGEINEAESTLTWIIPKDTIGNPETGDTFVGIHAGTYLISQKDCEAPIHLTLAKDRAEPLISTYTVQY
jgi:hypothetical protein